MCSEAFGEQLRKKNRDMEVRQDKNAETDIEVVGVVPGPGKTPHDNRTKDICSSPSLPATSLSLQWAVHC